MIAKYKNIIIVIAIIGIGLIAYSFLRPDPTAESLLETTERQDDAQVLGDEIAAAINQINSLKLDRGVLDDPIMKRLIDHSKPILPEPVGRKNPFAPITATSNNLETGTTVIKTTTATSSTKTSTSTPGI